MPLQVPPRWRCCPTRVVAYPTAALLKPETAAAARSLNDVRAAIASLEDTSERAPVLRPIPELKPAQAAAEISDHGVLAVLEQARRCVDRYHRQHGCDADWRSAAAEDEAQPTRRRGSRSRTTRCS